MEAQEIAQAVESRPGFRSVFVVLLTLVWPGLSWAGPFLEVRSYNPFIEIYGRPAFFCRCGIGSRYRQDPCFHGGDVSLTEIETGPGGSLELDGEIYRLEIAYDRVLGQALEVGVRVPVIHQTGGWMDGVLTDWHDLLGVPNGKRDEQVPDSLRFYFDDGQGESFLKEEGGTGIGDLRFSVRYRVTPPSAGRALAVHAGLKLPTGEADALRGSGAMDASLGIGLSDPLTLRRLRTTLSANAGVLFLGDSEVLSAYQRSSVVFGGLQAAVRLTTSLSLIGGIQASSSYYDTEILAIGDESVALILGGDYRSRNGWQVRLGIVEDGLSRVDAGLRACTWISSRRCFAPAC